MKTTNAKLIELKAAYEANGPTALIEGCSGSNHVWGTRLWASAMAEKYGITGLHKDWTNEDGTPSAACLEAFPRVVSAIREARESIAGVWTFIDGQNDWLKSTWCE